MSTPVPVRLAFTSISRRLWAGGYNYQINLYGALHRYRPGEFTPVVFTSTAESADDLADLNRIPGIEVVQTDAFDSKGLLNTALALWRDEPAVAAFRAQNIDVVIETARFFGRRLPYPSVAWFPDLQHRRMPQLFTPAARWRREIGFRAQIASGRAIMLSSRSALQDFMRFYSAGADRASVVRFATRPAPELLTEQPFEVLQRYQLPPNFFYLPNQFYRHKNHQVVIDALTILAERGLDVVIALSGRGEDLHEPDYFDTIQRQIEARALGGNFRYLGMIPLSDVYALLRVSTALINPSRFEGWSTTVEEAKSFGVPMILSDLDVHREQTGGTARYFGTDDPATLADHLARMANDPQPPLVRNLLPNLDERGSAFAADFADIVQRAIRSSRK